MPSLSCLQQQNEVGGNAGVCEARGSKSLGSFFVRDPGSVALATPRQRTLAVCATVRWVLPVEAELRSLCCQRGMSGAGSFGTWHGGQWGSSGERRARATQIFAV